MFIARAEIIMAIIGSLKIISDPGRQGIVKGCLLMLTPVFVLRERVKGRVLYETRKS